MLVHFSNSAIRETLADIFRGKLEYERFKFGKLHKIVIFTPDDAVRQIGILKENELQSLLKSTDRAGKTALYWAAHLNRGDIIRELLRKGAEVFLKTSMGTVLSISHHKRWVLLHSASSCFSTRATMIATLP